MVGISHADVNVTDHARTRLGMNSCERHAHFVGMASPTSLPPYVDNGKDCDYEDGQRISVYPEDGIELPPGVSDSGECNICKCKRHCGPRIST